MCDMIKKKLFCAFIDDEKAFDTVDRGTLFVKLINEGLKSKMVNMIKATHNKVSSCVKGASSFSEFFDISIGFKQGEPLSPIMILLFLNDICKNIDLNVLPLYDFNQLGVFVAFRRRYG